MQFSDFIVNAMDPIVNQAAKLHFMYGGAVEVPMIVRGASGAGTGAAAQHSQSLCLLYTSPSPRDRTRSRMPSSA